MKRQWPDSKWEWTPNGWQGTAPGMPQAGHAIPGVVGSPLQTYVVEDGWEEMSQGAYIHGVYALWPKELLRYPELEKPFEKPFDCRSPFVGVSVQDLLRISWTKAIGEATAPELTTVAALKRWPAQVTRLLQMSQPEIEAEVALYVLRYLR